MANNFKIVISATDRASNVVRGINNEFSRGIRPLANLCRSAQRLGREISKNPIAKAFIGIGRVALGVASSIASIAAPMAAVVGIGSLAGVVAMVAEWGRMGFEIAKTSTNLGMATSDLQSLRGAANLAGVSTETLTGGLKAVGDTMQDALGGRNQSALLMLNKIGVGIHKTADGSIDVARGFKDIATYVASIKSAQVQGLVARQFGLEGALPLLRKGAVGIEEYQRKIAEFGGVSTSAGIVAAEQFGLKLNYLSAAGNGLKIAIGSAIMPALEPMVASLTDFINLNREPIGKQLGIWAENFGKWIKNIDFKKATESVESFGRGIVKTVDGIVRMIEVIEKLSNNPAKYLLGGFPRMVYDAMTSSTPASAPGSGKSDLNGYANDVEKRYGLPKNLLNSVRSFGEKSGSNSVSPKGARGVMQFMPETWKQYGKGDPSDDQASIEAGGRYFKDLLTRYHGNVDAAITEYNGGSDQAKAVEKGGRPSVPETQKYLSRVTDGMQQMNGEPMEHVIKMTIEGLPAGTSAKATNRTGKSVPVRVNHAMPTLAAG